MCKRSGHAFRALDNILLILAKAVRDPINCHNREQGTERAVYRIVGADCVRVRDRVHQTRGALP